MGDGRWAMGDGRWATGDGRFPSSIAHRPSSIPQFQGLHTGVEYVNDVPIVFSEPSRNE